MRILVMFDLPVLTKIDRRNYNLFRKFLLQNGFVMMQESIYCKLVLNKTSAESVLSNIRKNKPPKGLIQMMTITEKQFSEIELVAGAFCTDVVISTDRYIEL